MLAALGDEYIAQHVHQAYREYVETTSYRTYVTSSLRLLTGADNSWTDIIEEMEEAEKPDIQPKETEAEIRARLLAKINGKEE